MYIPDEPCFTTEKGGRSQSISTSVAGGRSSYVCESRVHCTLKSIVRQVCIMAKMSMSREMNKPAENPRMKTVV